MTVQSILTHLYNDAPLSALVSDRIYRTRLPQRSSYPAIIFRSSEEPQGDLSESTFGHHYQVEFEIYDRSFVTVDQVKTALVNALNNSALFSSICTSVADDDYIDDTNNYSIFLDYSIWF